MFDLQGTAQNWTIFFAPFKWKKIHTRTQILHKNKLFLLQALWSAWILTTHIHLIKIRSKRLQHMEQFYVFVAIFVLFLRNWCTKMDRLAFHRNEINWKNCSLITNSSSSLLKILSHSYNFKNWWYLFRLIQLEIQFIWIRRTFNQNSCKSVWTHANWFKIWFVKSTYVLISLAYTNKHWTIMSLQMTYNIQL